MFPTRRNNRSLSTSGSPWDLFREMDEMFNQLQRGFDGGRSLATREDQDEFFLPATDIRENDKGYLMAFDIPGVAEKDVKIEVKDGVLTVSGDRKRERSEEREGWARTERSYGRFTRSFSLPNDVDASKIEAQCENGELHLFIPKGEAAKPVSIPVKTKSAEGGPEHRGLMDRFFGKEKDVGAKSPEDTAKH